MCTQRETRLRSMPSSSLKKSMKPLRTMTSGKLSNHNIGGAVKRRLVMKEG